MKKLLVAILGIFMVFGSFMLSACDNQQARLTLSQENVSIEIRSDEVGSGEAVITADVSGVDKYSLTASANGYDEFLTVTTETVSASKTNIIITGVAENDSPSIVTVRLSPGNIEKYIYVDVFSEIQSMTKNLSADVVKDNYVVRGATTKLVASNLINFQPAKARKDITWSLDGAYTGITITGNDIAIEESFAGDSVNLIATSSNGVVSDTITVPVLDKIDENIELQWSYSPNSSFETITEDYDEFVIVPNLDNDEKFNGFVVVDYVGELNISGYAIDANGNITEDIVVNRYGSYMNFPLFKISTAQGKTNLNGDYKIGFKIGYANYNYEFDTMTAAPISIQAREKVNDISVSTLFNNQTIELEGTTQTLYSSYVDTSNTTSYGQEFYITISPSTVIGATNEYNIIVERTQAGLPISNDCPIDVWYRDRVNGNIWKEVLLTDGDGNGVYTIENGRYLSETTIYIKATEDLLQQSADGMRVTFQSMDNTNISTYMDLRLVKSVSVDDFTFDDGDFKIDSSENSGNIVKKKQFTLKGQTSVQGLYIINNSDAVTFGDIQYISNDENSVTFEITLTLKQSSYGITTVDTYHIAHENGLVSEAMEIDIFLPLKDASVRHDNGENYSNSVTEENYDQNSYYLNGVKTESTAVGLSHLMLKNDTATPISYSFNSINDNFAEAKIEVGFVDFVESALVTFEMFKELSKTQDGIATILTYAKDAGNSSNIAYFTNDFSSIITKGVGFTYAVMYFTGKGVDNVDPAGNVTFARIILIESYISPNSMSISPEKDKDVTLYSVDSLASTDSVLTRKSISIRFAKPDVTYTDITNIEFVSRNELMGRQSITGSTVTWAKGRYSLSNVVVTKSGITFNIEVVGTFGELAFYDTLDVHYVLKNEAGDKIYDIYMPISITIKNAQRVESLKWKNADDDGLYFEVGDVSAQYILVETLPSSARNNNLSVVKTNEAGTFIERDEDFVSIGDEVASNVLSINLSASITSGMTGYVYLIPADAVYNNQIRYYYLDGTTEKEGMIEDSMLGQYKDSALGITYYDFLVNEAYFKSNATESDAITPVSFSKILIKIKVVVADGSSFEHAYRIYDNEGFKGIKADLYYTVMNSLDLTGEAYDTIYEFNGGLQGKSEEVSVKLADNAFAITNNGKIRNIAFVGNVIGDGFVASINNGQITNVTVDVDGMYASRLTATGLYGGGIVGTNYGDISGSAVLGLNISGSAQNVGGIAGINYGAIENSRVEFYNLVEAIVGGVPTYAVNTFSGENVGGIVGVIANESSIYRTFAYAYDYPETADKQVLLASNKVGAFAGIVNDDAVASSTTIDYSFSVVNVSGLYYSAYDNVSATNYYIGYVDGGGNYKVNYVYGYETNQNFLNKTKTGFESYVNGENEYHLAGLMQDERIESVDYDVQTVHDTNGYYKSVKVTLPTGDTQSKGIMFAYVLRNGAVDLTSTERNDLDKLNTITLAQLVGEERVNKNIIVTSSNTNVVKVVGSSLKVLKTGKTTLTLASKQDVSILKTIELTVVYAVSSMQISWTSVGGSVNYVHDNSTLTLQKTRSRDFMVSYEKPNVYLGATAQSYDLVANAQTLDIQKSKVDALATGTMIESMTTGESSFKFTANEDSVATSFEISPVVFDNATLQDAIKSVFKRSFSVQAIDGVISFAVSGQELPITPSLDTAVKVEIKTTDKNDSVVPMISLGQQQLKVIADGANKFNYMLARDVESGKAILTAVVSLISSAENDGIYTKTYSVLFSVADDYKANIAENMDFVVHFESDSGNSSKDWNGTFTLNLTRQNFTTIDVQTKKVSYSQFESTPAGLVEVHTAEEGTAVLAPGNSAIMQININPTFAYFDYVDFSYSFGDEIVLDAVNVEVVQLYNSDSNRYTRRIVDGRIQTVGSSLRFTPTVEEKSTGALYYKIWINTTVAKDAKIKFTATFKKSNDEYIAHVNSFITVSYLTQPQVTVDGLQTAYVAKGAMAKVKIDVLPDQKVDTIAVDGDNVSGVSLGALSKPNDDNIDKGIRTYTADLYVSVTANTDKNDVFYIQAQVSRELNGQKEYKTSIATVVIVDFKVDTDNIEIVGENEGVVTVWQGVPKAFSVEYSLLPEDYNVASDTESQNALKEINKSKESFLKDGFYPAEANVADANYLINYKYEKNAAGDYVPQKQTLKDRLFYEIGNDHHRVNVFDEPNLETSPVDFEISEGKISVYGLKTNGSIDVVLVTYVSAGGHTTEYVKRFTIIVKAYSDEDLPLTISNATEFNALNVGNSTNVDINDYILTNDIVLENHTAFDTKAIRSLDGNGFTIFIKSFNTTLADTSVLNLALFNNVVSHTIDGQTIPTILKNIRVNLYNGGQITVNVNKYKTINIAGFAVENNGVITNCEVVSFYTESVAMGSVLSQQACTAHSNPTGINVTYVNGTNTTEKVYHSGNNDWNTEIAGFVLTNAGSITNSRVGGDKVIIVGNEKLLNDASGNEKPSGYTYASYQNLDTFNIIGQGNMAGFVLTNSSGYIASSFAKNIDMDNKSKTTSFYVAGFVGTNNSSIITSYIEGVETPNIPEDDKGGPFAREGSSIKSEMGYIAGFIYNNEGSIKDSYSNILIANSVEQNKVYLASGFVYKNEGLVENCYSASQIQNANFTQMNFSGVSANGNLLANGTYTNCYFFNKIYAGVDEVNDTTTESRYSTGAMLIPNPTLASYFYGFALADGEIDGIWRIDPEKGITLIETNDISISHRYIYYVDEGYEGTTAENEQGKYILPYSTLTFIDRALEIDTSLGGEHNPIVIVDAQDWVDVTGLTTSTHISSYFNSNSIWGNYRIVNNIDLAEIASSDTSVKLLSSNKAFSGKLNGNGFRISGISITNDNPAVAFGLFASIEKRGKSFPLVTNVNLKVNQVVAGDSIMVGALAGYIIDSKIINIKIEFDESSMVTGLNFAGSLSGLAYGDNTIKNIIIENPCVTADRYSIDSTGDYLVLTDLKDFRTSLKGNLNFNTTINSPFIKSLQNYSYAGGLIGLVENYNADNSAYDYIQKDVYSINNVRVNGIVRVQGQVVGGVFGLTGYQTNIRDVGLSVEGKTTANSSYILSTKYFAGGVAGQSFGAISRTFAVHEQKIQDEIEDNMSSFYGGNTSVERGALNLFYAKDTKYTQEYIGGLVGYVGSGNIEISYSKLNVTSPSAKYAGGIFGGMALQDTSAYLTEVDLAYDQVFTKYLINEVYATGDVRANEMAGGLIGVIQGEASRVAMLAVNAFNYFTTYDYETDTYTSLNEGQTNVSNNFKINALVGCFKKFETDKWVDHIIPNNDDYTMYKSYLTLMLAMEEIEGENGIVITNSAASVAVYEDYKINGQAVKMSLFEMAYSGSDPNPSITKVYVKDKAIYVITGPSLYTSSTTGHTYTQEGFLNSGSWSFANWSHDMEDLFPEIRYKRNTDVLYLDCFNVEQVFKKMSNNSYRVVVRGLVSEDSEEYADIDLSKCKLASGEDIPKIKGFSGRLEGGIYKTTISNGREDVKIIAAQNFIESVGVGFYCSGVTVEYTKKDYGVSNISIGENAGLFVESELTDANISNLTLILGNSVQASVKTGKNQNVGLVAPALKSTSINNLKIIAKNIAGEYILTVVNKGDTIELEHELNVGLIAGELQQNSTISIMQINQVSVETDSEFVSLSGTKFKKNNVGGYFGKTSRRTNAQLLRIIISDLTNSANFANKTENVYSKFGITDLYDNSYDNPDDNPSLNIGGYIGFAEGIGYIATQDGEEIRSSYSFVIEDSPLSELYAGGIIGQSQSDSPLTINGQNSIIQTKVICNQTVNNLYAGGFAGKTAGGKISLQNFDALNLTVGQSENKIDTPSQEGFAGSYMSSQGLEVSTEAYVGIAVGCTESQFEFVGKENGYTYLNQDTQPIKLCPTTDATKINFGSVVGFTNFERANENSITYKTLNVIGRVKSNAQVVVEGENTDNFLGGFVGQIAGQAESTTKSDIQIGEESSILRFDGAFYVNAKQAFAGGIIGKYHSQKKSDLSITKTSFGGAIKFYGSNSNNGTFTAGGTIGETFIENGGSSSAIIAIENNYNYGDVFVEYAGALSVLSEYNFGGIIGHVTSANYNIVGNYSLTTNHNSRQSSVNNACVNALFGSGVPASISEKNNYYNHAVTLTTDDNGIDIGYKTSYAMAGFGYSTDTRSSQSGSNMINQIREGLKLIDQDCPAGHKLNPSSYDSTGLLPTEEGMTTTNGIMYYTTASSLTNASLHTKTGETLDYKLKNVAIIGDGLTLDYTVDAGATESIHAFVNGLDGYSFISGIAMNANVVQEKGATNTGYGVLVGSMTGNSVVYAVNARGTIEVGSGTADATPYVSGLVGEIRSGKIFDCSTDLDIVYRAGKDGDKDGEVAGLTYTSQDTALIENCYVAGSIKTMINAKVYAFTNGNSTSTINNCYTIAKLDLNDYTVANDSSITAPVVVNDGNANNVFYDSNALNYGTYGTSKGTAKSYSELRTTNSIFGNSNTDWVVDYNFNYGYPTLKYGYLKTSSYATATEFTAEDGATGYDAYVKEATYTRLANGTIPEADDFYMIPNASVLAEMQNIAGNTTISKNFALLYDINLANANDDYKGLSELTFAGKFDGREKTISSLQNNLFKEVFGAEIRNLRLTDAVTSTSLLANTISGATISNMTLSGFIESPTYKVKVLDSDMICAGALASTSSNSKINTITNLTDIKAQGLKYDAQVGGILGSATDTTILYSSNYGPINVKTSDEITTYEITTYVGGLVGALVSGGETSTIQYSYNATSVLNNYATSTALATTSGNFYAGGLVGWSSGSNILDSYNSGMIKSGNKSNAWTSYAGGIVGYANAGEISRCYNQGPVEARATNPTYRWYFDFPELQLYTTTERNVYAYGIGYVDSTSISDVELINENYLDETIYNNGSVLGKDILIKSWSWDFIEQRLSSSSYDHVAGEARGIRWYLSLDHWFYRKIEYSVSNWWPEDGDLYEGDQIVVTSRNELGMPTAFIIKIQKRIWIKTQNKTIWPDWWHYELNGSLENADDEPGANRVKEATDIYEAVAIEYADREGSSGPKYDTLKALLGGSWDDGKIENLLFSNTDISTKEIFLNHPMTENNIVKGTRSQVEDNSDFNKTTINAQEHYIADKNNLDRVFNSGIYSYTAKIESESLPYFSNKNIYTISATLSGKKVQTYVKYVKENESASQDYPCASIEYVVYSADPLVGDLQVTINVDYTEEIEIDTSEMNYYYIDDYSIGINSLGTSNYSLVTDGYDITTGNDTKYTQLIKLSTIDGFGYNAEDKTDLQPEDDNQYLLYLAYDEATKTFVYIPNATLTNDNGDEITVNKLDFGKGNYLTDLRQGSGFVTNVQTAINSFADKTLYSRVISSSVFEKRLDFHTSGQGSISISSEKMSKPGTVTLEYGKTLSGIQSTVQHNPDNKSYEVTLTTPTENIIGLSGGAVALGYNAETTTWYVSSALNNIEIDGVTLTANITANKVVFGAGLVETENSAIKTSIEMLFSGIEYIANEDKTYIINDPLSDIGILQSDVKDSSGEIIGQLSIAISDTKNWEYFREHGIVTQDTNRLILNTANGDSSLDGYYSIGDVVIRKGRITFAYTRNRTLTITDYGMTKEHTDENIYTNICLYENGSLKVSAESFMKVNSVTESSLSDEWNGLTGEVKVQVGFYSTHKMTAEELDQDEFQIALKEGSEEEIKYILEGAHKTDAGAREISINSVLQSVSITADKSVLIKRTDCLAGTESEKHLASSFTIKVNNTYTDVDQDGNKVEVTEEIDILLLTVHYNGETSDSEISQILYYYNEDGNLQKREVDDDGDANTPNITVEGVILPLPSDTDTLYAKDIYDSNKNSYKLGALLSIKPTSYFKNDVQLKQDVSDSYYLIVNPKYTCAPDNSWIESALYEWKEFTTKPYSPLYIDPVFHDTLWECMDVKVDNYILPNYIVKDDTNKKVSILLNKEQGIEWKPLFKFELKDDVKALYAEIAGLVIDSRDEALPIILTRDISFNGADLKKHGDANVIGNGYYLSFYGSPVYESLYVGSNSFIKDVNYLNETYNQSFFISKALEPTTTTYLYHINFYGSVVNMGSDAGALINDTNVDGENYDKVNITGINSFVSINGARNLKTALSLFASTVFETDDDSGDSTGVNYGIITAPRGDNGQNATVNDKDKDGENGCAIYVTAITVEGNYTSLRNHGIVYSGDGGNGAGGSTSRAGVDYVGNSTQKALDCGTGGKAGEAGGIAGFDSSNTLAKNGLAGSDGAKNRDGFGRLTMQNRTYWGKASEPYGIAYVYSFVASPSTLDVSQLARDTIYTYMFGVSNTLEMPTGV